MHGGCTTEQAGKHLQDRPRQAGTSQPNLSRDLPAWVSFQCYTLRHYVAGSFCALRVKCLASPQRILPVRGYHSPAQYSTGYAMGQKACISMTKTALMTWSIAHGPKSMVRHLEVRTVHI